MSMTTPPEGQNLVGKLWSEFKDLRDRSLRDERMEEEITGGNPYAVLDRMSVLLECRAFHDAGFVKLHPKRCCQQLTKLLWFLAQGEAMDGPESIDVFFGVTKLFQSPDGNLRRLVYLFLRSVVPFTSLSSLIVVTQSLVKDMFQDTPLFKGNALRVLGAIVDPSMLGQLERYFKQMLVDKDDYVASTALTTSLLLMQKQGAAETISRWVSEVQTVLTTRSDMVQFHALALLRSIKRADRLAVAKVVQTLMRGNMRSPLGLCLLIRYAQGLMASDPASVEQKTMLDFLEACMRNKSDMVVFEAARAVCAIPNINARDLNAAFTMLHMFLSSPKPSLRFAAVRTLHRLAAVHPVVVAKCNDDLETLIGDSNRTIATLAVTTLLKTGSETGIDRLMKQITTFLGEVGSDELKVTVVQAIHELALRMPNKNRAIMTFLASALREEGGYEFKKSILDGLLDIMQVTPEAQAEGLTHLCEFIEDCEFPALATRVLHLLGDAGPSAPVPSTFIRFIYNRVILEGAQVRASAVSALAKFASRVPELRNSIIPLLQRCLDDDDDEVRDRATMYLRMLHADTKVTGVLHESAANSVANSPAASSSSFQDGIVRSLTGGRLPLPVTALTRALTLYAHRPAAGPFSFSALPHVDVPGVSSSPVVVTDIMSGEGGYGYSSEVRAVEAVAKVAKAKARADATSAAAVGGGDGTSGSATAASLSASSAASGTAAGSANAAAEALYKIPEFASFGPLFRSSPPLALTEDELEYLVTLHKHVFERHIVFQFTIRNTVPEVILEKTQIAVSCSDAALYKHVVSISAPKVKAGIPATAYVAFARDEEQPLTAASFSCELRFNSRECDPATGEPLGDATHETYPLDSCEVSPADYVAPLPVADFRSAWEAMGPEGEVMEQYSLAFKNVADAVAGVINLLGMAACEGTGVVKAGATKHNAYLAGVFLGGVKVLTRMQVTVDAESGCVLKIAIRSEDVGISQLLLDCVA